MKKWALLSLLLFSLRTAQAALLVDDFHQGGNLSCLGTPWNQYTDGHSSVVFQTNHSLGFQSEKYCGHMTWSLKPGTAYPYAGVQVLLQPDGRVRDLTRYTGLRFYARGLGACSISLPMATTRTLGNHYSAGIILEPEWQLYEIDFTEFVQRWGEPKPWEPAQIWAVGFNAEGNSGEIDLAAIELYSEKEQLSPPPRFFISYAPKINQVGYLPEAQKYFSIVAETAKPGDAFVVLDAAGNTVYADCLSDRMIDDTLATGEQVCRGDFSGLTTPGIYSVVVSGRHSHTFAIQDNLYAPLFIDALRCFSIIRCGTEVQDEKTGIRHPACHLSDARLREKDGRQGDFTGGWHNAGDYGKWCHISAIDISYLLWLYELRQPQMEKLRIAIPESGNNRSDLLNEAQWGLRFMLKLQRENGSVYHKIDTQPDFCFGTPPDRDPYPRFASLQSAVDSQEPSAIDAGVFVAVMAQAARVYATLDAEFAATCKQAAQKSWNWLRRHPATGQTDPYYTDPDTWQEYLWAKMEIYRLTNEPALATDLDQALDSRDFQPLSWQTPQAFGYLSLWLDQRTKKSLRIKIHNQIQRYGDDLQARVAENGYGVVLGAREYNWESNETVLHRANVLLFAFVMTGKDKYKKLALNQLDYILGLNSLDQVFVTGYGSRPVQHPYHWAYAAYQQILPGWVTGGPNGYTTGADSGLMSLIKRKTPPAKCYLDLCSSFGSWASNEGETSANAALLFLTGFFSSIQK